MLRFCLYAIVEAATLRSIILRYAGAPIATHTCFFVFFPFVYSEMSLFPSIFFIIPAFSLYGEYVVRSFLPDGVFLPCDHGLYFFYVRIQSINRTNKKVLIIIYDNNAIEP